MEMTSVHSKLWVLLYTCVDAMHTCMNVVGAGALRKRYGAPPVK